jgi:serine/threonine protein kinase
MNPLINNYRTDEEPESREEWNLVPGSNVGSYKVEEQLCFDYYSGLYKVRDQNGICYTARILHSEISIILKEDFFRLTSLQHKFLAKTIECFEENGRLIAITEFIKGTDLRTKMSRLKSVDFVTSLEIAIKIAECLGYLRDQGIIHSNLHPENIIFTEYEDIKILDPISVPQCLKKASVLKKDPAKIAYFPPETLFDPEPSGREDIYFFGAVLFLLLTGKDPYSNLSPAKMLAAKRTKDPLKPSRLNRKIDKHLEELIAHCMDRNSGNRCESFDEIRDVLKKALNKYKMQNLKRTSTLRKNITKIAAGFIAATIILFIIFLLLPALNNKSSGISASIKIEARRTDPWGNIVPFKITDGATVYSNDGFRIYIEAEAEFYLSIINITPDGKARSLLPKSAGSILLHLKKGTNEIFPSEKKWYRFDESTGLETIYIVASTREWLHLSNIVLDNPLSEMADRAAASKIMSLLDDKMRLNSVEEDTWDSMQLPNGMGKNLSFKIHGNENAIYKIILDHK